LSNVNFINYAYCASLAMARLNIVKPRSNDYAVIASQLYHTLGAHAMGQDRTLAMMIVHGFMLCPCCTNIYIYIYIYISAPKLLACILVYNAFCWFCREKKHDALCIAYFSYFFMCYLLGRCRWACELMHSWLNSLISDPLGHRIVQRRSWRWNSSITCIKIMGCQNQIDWNRLPPLLISLGGQ